ncbi:MAG: hypothetical protein MRY75_20025 [Marivita sp.]|nr:hypothetical protein [Marivita sp.]MCI5112840.1 hypothetical protein [Marivita sp.]
MKPHCLQAPGTALPIGPDAAEAFISTTDNIDFGSGSMRSFTIYPS